MAEPTVDSDDPALEPPVGRFAILEDKVFRRLVVGGTCTFMSMQISVVARGWLAFDLTGTNTALGGVLIGFGIATIFAIPTGGVLADRFPKRTVIVVAGLIQTFVTFGVGLAVSTEVAAYWMLVVASVLQGAMISLLGPARLAFLAELVPRDRMTNAIFLSQSSMQMTRVFGPAAAGALIGVAYFGIAGVYYLSAAFAAIGILATLGLPDGRPAIAPTRSPREDLVDGFRYVRGNPRVSHLLLLSFGVVLIGFPHVAFLPVLAEDIFNAGSTGYGILNTAAAVGALAVSIGLAGVATRRVARIQAWAAVAFGVTLMLFGLSPVFALSVLLMVLVGAASAAFQALNNSLILSIAPVEYHGRVQSLLMLSFSGYGLAALPFGIIADATGLQATLTGMGVAVVVISFASMLVTARRSSSDLTNVDI